MADKMLWDKVQQKRIPCPSEVEKFFKDYVALCKKHNLCLSHEDSEGSFKVVAYRDYNIQWVLNSDLDIRK